MVFVGDAVHSQQTILLHDGSIVKGIRETMPTRDVDETEDGITVTYEFNAVSKHQDPVFAEASILRLDGFGTNNRNTEPSIPFRWDSFVVPQGVKVKVEVTDSAFIEMPLEMAPSRPPRIASDTTLCEIEEIKPISPYEGFFPKKVVSEIKHLNYCGNHLVDICFTPIKYDYDHKIVRIYTRVTYKINYLRDFVEKQNNLSKRSFGWSDTFLERTTLNGDAGLSKEKLVKSPNKIANYTGHRYFTNYIIVSVPKYSQAVNRFAEWKRTMGYSVTIYLDENWTIDKIKQRIFNENIGERFVLIVGDHEDVPAEYIDKSVYGISFTFWSDYHYAVNNADDEEIPSSYVGRISVSSLSEANTALDRIINYEKSPILDDSFYNTMLSCAYFQDGKDKDNNGNIIPADGYEDRRFVLTAERIRNYLLNKGKQVDRIYAKTDNCIPLNWNNDVFANGDSIPDSLRIGNFAWGGSQMDVVNKINDGTFCVMYNGHGTNIGWSNFGSIFFVTIPQWITNGEKCPVVLSFTCSTGNFKSINSCFAERLQRTENGGSVGIIAATRESFSGYNDALAEGLIDTFWPTPGLIPTFPNKTINNYPHSYQPELRMGKALVIAMKKARATWRYEYYDYMFYEYFGDPTMRIYTEKPTPYENIVITRTSEGVRVQMPYISGTMLSFYDKGTGEVVSYQDGDITDETVTGNPNNIVVCVSGSNKIPLIDDPTQTYYLQNETVSGPRTIQSNVIKAGNNVTNLKPQGEAAFDGGGKVTLIGNEVILDAGTTVEVGTELEIRNP